MKSFHIKTYGCTLNMTDSNRMRYLLKADGYCETEDVDADVIILNTCTVKHATESKIMEELKRLIGEGRKVVVAGCLYRHYERIKSIDSNIPILSPGAVCHIVDAVRCALKEKPYMNTKYYEKGDIPMADEWKMPIASIPLCEGCVGKCTFCETRLARGRLRSYYPETIKKQFLSALKKGAKEIRLTAQDTGCYGKDLVGQDTDLVSLLNNLVRCNGDYRIRLGMINPEHAYKMLDGLLDVFMDEHLFKFVHLPVQSGSDNVLKDMGRNYVIAQVLEIVSAFRKRFDEITIATDIIAGYPTETEEDHKLTVELLKNVEFDIVNLSRFAPRLDTPAAKLKQLDNQIVKRRTVELHNLIRDICKKKNRKLVGKQYSVLLTENKQRKLSINGRNNAYRKIALADNNPEIMGTMARLGSWVNVTITGYTSTTLFGKLRETYENNR